MKVIQIMDNLETDGGVNSVVYDLCQAQRVLGADVSLIGIMDRGNSNNEQVQALRALGVSVHCLGAKSKPDALLRYVFALRNLIYEISGGETVICNLHLKLSVLMGTMAAVGLSNVVCIETYHNTYHHYWLQYNLCKFMIREYICVSETAYKEMQLRFHTPKHKLCAIPNGVNRVGIRAQMGNIKEGKSETVNFVSVGRMSYEKNLIIPVQAFAQMQRENVTYTVIGDGPQRDELASIAKGHENIRFLGSLPRTQVIPAVAQADLVILPSLWEGRSISMLEAMAQDKPLILSDVPGLRTVFDESPLNEKESFRVCRFGYLVRTSDVQAYINCIHHFAEHRELWPQMSAYVEEISKQSDISKVAADYLKEYKKFM